MRDSDDQSFDEATSPADYSGHKFEELPDGLRIRVRLPNIDPARLDLRCVPDEIRLYGEFSRHIHSGVLQDVRSTGAGWFSTRIALPNEVDTDSMSHKIDGEFLIIEVRNA